MFAGNLQDVQELRAVAIRLQITPTYLSLVHGSLIYASAPLLHTMLM